MKRSVKRAVRRFTAPTWRSAVLPALLYATVLIQGSVANAVPLGSYNVKPTEVSFSGISSGGYMAVQFGVAWSSIVKGVGPVASGPYYCAMGSSTRATDVCPYGTPDIAPLIAQTNSWASSGAIDPTSNMAAQKFFLFNGYNDGVVKATSNNQLYNYYANYTSKANIYYKNNLRAAHSHVTANYGQACDVTGGSFVNNCGYDAAGSILQFVTGALNPKATGTLSGKLIQFDQTDFVSSPKSISMDTKGYAYVPATCAAQQPCQVHVALHGCSMQASLIGDAYYAHGGYNEWADTNHIIVLYPQTIASSIMPLNPLGCWDIWGYNDSNYANKYGLQIKTLKAMIDRVTANYDDHSIAPTGTFSAPANVAVIDSSATKVELVWKAVAGASGYNVYRGTCAGCAMSKLNSTPSKGASYADNGLTASKTYYYTVRAVNSAGVESADSTVVSRATAATPPFCDPYFSSNYMHWQANRAYVPWYNAYIILANGSGDYLGVTGPLAVTTGTLARQTSAGYFRLGVCP
jgi:poly(3-hydroxybutyrate) depolymerase